MSTVSTTETRHQPLKGRLHLDPPVSMNQPVSPTSSQQPSQDVLAALLGNGIKEWPFTETSLIHALALKTEQEKTRQEFYRMETVSRSLELLRHAMAAQIPGYLIPQLFMPGAGPVGGTGSKDVKSLSISTNSGPNPYSNSEMYKADPNFKFGSGSRAGSLPGSGAATPSMTPTAPAPQMAHRRQNSPARMGAQAVAALNTPQRGVAHKHHQSMPVVGIPEAAAVSFGKPVSRKNSAPSQSEKPTQESMISSHHLIQFHHWQPESDEKPPIQGDIPSLPAPKRRRSSGSDGESGSSLGASTPTTANFVTPGSSVAPLSAPPMQGVSQPAPRSRSPPTRRSLLSHIRTRSDMSGMLRKVSPPSLRHHHRDSQNGSSPTETDDKPKLSRFPNNILGS
ncbi:unnamed protein product [Kuraishia capsulata CBS 1993]|uniref:Protein BOP3 n=1 Tax=Kuraishia capsulata CBS 1993 TaxID=1382522 RepID=W6MUX9_9ASCO|nr:uncharacterized protein KUCA_T00001951001 [Kuraishia capsulata CBS 1993]CDK25980.1 unnamed protein product [Kuraishia capsulata CBS 1993]